MKNFLVIGGSSGIGKALVKLLSVDHHVFATYHENEMTSNGNVKYYPLNVLNESLDFSFLPEIIDGLVFCPGTIQLKPFNRIPIADFMNDYALNVGGAIKCIQAVFPNLKKSKDASIVLFSTVAVQVGMPFHSIVSSSKGAIEGLTKALSSEFAPTIRVNCIAPSLTDTPLAQSLLNSDEKILASANRHPLKKIGTTNDIASMAQFLLTENSSWITGQIFHVDGGMSTIK
ncbi:MAG TPA: SDR family oxidoreductase [Chitinophagaceae bacterium]|nr:SDR family oxidoreductase [Chitinophagaceae bacterium]